jgi:hypothetical protein
MSVTQKKKIEAYERFFNQLYIARNITLRNDIVIKLLDQADGVFRGYEVYCLYGTAEHRRNYEEALLNLGKIEK